MCIYTIFEGGGGFAGNRSSFSLCAKMAYLLLYDKRTNEHVCIGTSPIGSLTEKVADAHCNVGEWIEVHNFQNTRTHSRARTYTHTRAVKEKNTLLLNGATVSYRSVVFYL